MRATVRALAILTVTVTSSSMLMPASPYRRPSSPSVPPVSKAGRISFGSNSKAPSWSPQDSQQLVDTTPALRRILSQTGMPRTRRSVRLNAVTERQGKMDMRGGGGGGTTGAESMLLATAILWGTYPPALKVLFAQEGAPTDPLLICAVRFAIMATAASFTFVPLRDVGSKVLSGRAGLAAFELGALGVAGTLLNTASLASTSAIRVAILLSLVNVFTPLLAALVGKTAEERTVKVPSIIACIMALFSTLYALSDKGAGGDSLGIDGLTLGDLEAMAAAFAYSSTKVRLGSLTKEIDAPSLNSGRFLGQGIIACAVLAAHLLTTQTSLQSEWPHSNDLSQWAILAFTALISGMLSSILQAKGQQTVTPAVAQPIFSTVTVWSTVFSALVLHETITPSEIVGGLGIVAASLVNSLRI